MSKKINKVFLNATADQIKEYGLEADVTNFTSMDKLVEVVKADIEKKVAERKYDLSDGFTVIDGAAKVSADLKDVAKDNYYRLSAVDFEKIISGDTKVTYTSEGTTDHRIASFESVGTGKVTNLNQQTEHGMAVYRSDYAPTGAGEAEYEEAIAEQQKENVDYSRFFPDGGAIVGYNDLTIENSGRTAAVTTEGEGFGRKATVTYPYAVSAIGGKTDLDYQYDSTKALDKKDEMLVGETFTESFVGSTVSTGSISVKDSQVRNIKGDMSEQIVELAQLHPNDDFEHFAEPVMYAAAGYETVTIDNSTVLGDIIGGSRAIEAESTGSKETFLDKADLSGQFYAVAEAAPNQDNQFASDNTPLFSYIDAFKMTEKEAEAKAKELGAKATKGEIENPEVNKYEIVELGLNNGGEAEFAQIKTGKFVYLTEEEVNALSAANQERLAEVEDEKFKGGRVAFAGRQVTDENFTTFTKEPAGNELNTQAVYRVDFAREEKDGTTTQLGSYYLKDDREIVMVGGVLEANLFEPDKSDAGYRAAEAITAENFKTEAVKAKVYPMYSDYAEYTFSKEMTAEEAAEANKALMAQADQKAWVKNGESDAKTLFAVEKISGGKETFYFLTADELSALGAFGKDAEGKNIKKSTREMDVSGAFNAATGWVFVDPEDRRAEDADGNDLYRAGAAATAETLDSFKELTEANSSTEQPYTYELVDVVYDAKREDASKLLLDMNDGAFAAYLGENGEYVIDGEIQYRAAGYNLSGNIQGSEHVTADKKTFNTPEYNYSASIERSLTEKDADEEGASPRGGELTQNKRIFKDAYVTEDEEQYVTLDAAQDTYVHNFIDVYAAQSETTSYELLNGWIDGLDTGVQAVNGEGKPLYLKKNDVSGRYEQTTEVTDTKCNKVVLIFGYQNFGYDYSERLTVKVDGKDVPAFYDQETKQLTAEKKDKEGIDRMEAWFAEDYVIGQQVYKYTLEGDDTVYFMTEAEADQVTVKGEEAIKGELTKGDAVEGVVHYGYLVEDASDIKSYTDGKTRVLDNYMGNPITKDAQGNPQQAVAKGGVIYSNIDGAEFAGEAPETVNGQFVYYKSIEADPTYFYTIDERQSYSDLEFAQLKANEEAAGIATWELTKDANDLPIWKRTAATGEVSTYTPDFATVKTAEKKTGKDSSIATGAIVIKNGSEIKGSIDGYKDVTVQDSKVADVFASDYTSETKQDLSTKKGKVGKDNRQTITTTETLDGVEKYSAIGSFTLANAKDRMVEGEDGNDKIEQSAEYVSGYETVKVANANVGDFWVNAYEFRETTKTVKDYTGDADDLRADYVEDYQTLANTGREGDGVASYVVSKVMSASEEYTSKSAAVGSFEATGRTYTFDVADKNRANTIGSVSGYDQVTLTNVNAGGVDSTGASEYTSKSSYGVKSNAKTGKDAATNSGNYKSTSDSAGTLVASNTVTDAKNENDLTIDSIGGYQSVTLTNVGVNDGIWSTQKSTSTSNGSITEEFDASTMRQVNIDGGQKYDVSDWSWGAYAFDNTWDFQNSKVTSAKYTSKDVYSPDAELTAKGQLSTKAVENEAVYNKYTQASTGRVLFLTEEEAIGDEWSDGLIGDKSTESGLKAGWAKDAAQFYRRNTETDAEVLGRGDLDSLSNTIKTAKYTNGKTPDDAEYKEYFFTAKEAEIAMLADKTLKLATGDDVNRLRSFDAAKQFVTDQTQTEPEDGIIGTIVVEKYVKKDFADAYITAEEFEAGKDKDYAGYTRDESATKYIRKASAGDYVYAGSAFAKEGADSIYAYTNKYDESVRYASENEFAILVADGKVVADDYAKGETLFAYRAEGKDAVKVINDNCIDRDNAFAAQKISTVFKYDRTAKSTYAEGAESYYVTAEEFAALSGKDGVLEGYVLDEETAAQRIMRTVEAKAATKDNIDVYFAEDGQQGLVIGEDELYRTELTDEAAKQLGIVYDEENLRAYSANGVDERADAVKTTVDGDIRNFKTVALDTMTVNGVIDNGYDTKSDSSISYSKKLSNKKGSDVYTEKSSSKWNYTENAVGSIELVDTDVLEGVVGYDKVSISTKNATSTIGGIEKRYTTSKNTSNVSIVTTDAQAYFSQEMTGKSTSASTSSVKGDLKVAGLKAAEKLVLDQSEHFDNEDDATAEAKKQIEAFGEKKDADIRITGDIRGFANVSLTNVTLGGFEINAYGEKWNSKGGQTTYTLTNNDGGFDGTGTGVGNTTTVVSSLNESSTFSNTLGGNLELTNVNQMVDYTPSSEEKEETPDAAQVNTYLFNGKYYALTEDEKAALLPYAQATEGEDQARLNASVKTPATEVIEGQSMLTVKDFGKAEIGYTDNVYFKTSMVVNSEAAEKAYYYVKANQVDEWLDANKGETVDTSTKFYASPWREEEIEKADLLTADVSKYTYLDTTVYLTAAEADILGAKATADTAKYTRLSSIGDAVTADITIEAVADTGLVAVNKYIGTDETGKKEYYLTAEEFTGFTTGEDPVLNGTFGKVDGTTYQRIGLAAQTEFTSDTLQEVEDAVTNNGLGYGQVNQYWDGADDSTKFYASGAEFAQLKALDEFYKDYQKVDDTVYYLKAESIFTKTIDDNLNDYQAVNESAEVFEVSNNASGAVIGYLTKAEFMTLRNAAADVEAFDEIYYFDPATTYLRVADDTNNLIKINGVDGEGYVVEAEDTLKPFEGYVAATEDDRAETAANGFKSITMANSALSSADGSLTTTKTSEKLTSKKNDTIGKYTKTENSTLKNNVGTFEAVEGVNTVYGDVVGYKTVTLAGKLDDKGEALSTFGSFTSGTVTVKNSYSGNVELRDIYHEYNDDGSLDVYDEEDIYSGKYTEQTVEKADGKFDAANVTLGDVSGYTDVKAVFDATDDEDVLAKHTIGSITGGNLDTKTTATIKTIGRVKITDSTTTRKSDSAGSVEVANAKAGFYDEEGDYESDGVINGFEKVTVTGSEVGDVAGGKSVVKITTLELTSEADVTTTSLSVVNEATAFGTAALADSKVNGAVTGFKSVAFTNGVEVAGDVTAWKDDIEENPSRGEANTVCYAVDYGYNYVKKEYDNRVYLTVDEYKTFVKDEKFADAQIDLSASTYREETIDPEDNPNPTAQDMADTFKYHTDVAKRNNFDVYGNNVGYNGANPVETIVKGNGQDFSIDGSGAKIGGEVVGYQEVKVDGNSSFGAGYEGTAKNDTLVVNANLATFENLDFGEGKDSLELNGTFGTDVKFEDWNLEEVKGSGKMVVKTDDVDAVKEAFAGVEVIGSDNYAAETALQGLEMEKAIDLGFDTEAGESEVERDEWLGFCDEADYFKALNGGDLKLEGEIFDKGVATAKVSYDKGATWETVKSGDEIYSGADIKVFLDEGDKKVSNDYKISIAGTPA